MDSGQLSITAWGRTLPVRSVNHGLGAGASRGLGSRCRQSPLQRRELPVASASHSLGGGRFRPDSDNALSLKRSSGLFRSEPSVIIEEVGLLPGWKTALVDPCAGGRDFRQQLSIMMWQPATSGTNTQKLSITLWEAGASGANCQSVCARTVLRVRAVHQDPGGGSFLPPLSITRSPTPQPLRTWTGSPVGQGDGS